MNDHQAADEREGARHSKRPEWLSLRVVANATPYGPVLPMDSIKIEPTQHDLTNDINTTQPQPQPTTTAAATANNPRSRISSWLSQHFPKHEKEVPSPSFSSSWIGARTASTLSTKSMVSPLSIESAGQRQASSMRNSPTSPILPRLPFKFRTRTKSPKPSNDNNTAKGDRPLLHGTTLGSSNHVIVPLSDFMAYNDNVGDVNDSYGLYQTSSGSNYESMDERLDEINNDSSDSIYHEYWNNVNSSMCSSDATKGIYSDKGHPRHSTDGGNSCESETMDPKVTGALLGWQREPSLNISWDTRSDDMYLRLWGEERHTSLDLYGMRLDDAFRLYSENLGFVETSIYAIDQASKSFGQLYWRCNPTTLFRCEELVYIVTHSLLSLNTDVHAGREHAAMDEFCERTMDLINSDKVSIPLLLLGDDSENIWQQAMIDHLKTLYKSVKRSSLVPINPSEWSTLSDIHQLDQCHNYHHPHHLQKERYHDEPKSWNQLNTAFDCMFTDTLDTRIISHTSTKSISTLPQQGRRSKSLLSGKSSSWKLLRRKDTYRNKVGPYKEGPLSCQLNDEDWNICWVIVQQGHLRIFYHDSSTTITTAGAKLAGGMDLHGSNVSSPKINKERAKKSFMQQLASSTADTPVSAIPIGGTGHGQVVGKQATSPYQEVDIHLGNTFCELLRPHVFVLHLIHSTYLFDCGSESQAALWIRYCNFWAARETKVMLSRGPRPPPRHRSSSSSPPPFESLSPWKRPAQAAGASVLDDQGQQEAISTHLASLRTELQQHLRQQHWSGWTNGTWQDKKMYLELELRKYHCYHYSIHHQ